jgi:hypothetical protein
MPEGKGDTQPTPEALKRQVLFVPCRDKQTLHRWIKVFLGLDFPDCIVDPESTSSPMDMLWEVYDHALKNNDPEFRRVLYFAARDSFKTLAAAALEVLAVFHLDRDVAHMAAIESQSRKSQQYVKKFLSRPVLRDYVVGDNQEITWVVRYHNKETGADLSTDEFEALTREERDGYEEIRHYIRIVICTMAGANSEHVPLFVVDEVDVVRDPKAYEEAKMIPSGRGNKSPITLLTSTRKFSFGLVQKEIDAEKESGLKKRHWNIIDVTEACPSSRHQPELPRLPVYWSGDLLKVATPEQYEKFTIDQQLKYVRDDAAYAGCTTCKLYPMCRGRLATRQVSKSPLLKKIDDVIAMFRAVSLPTAKAQLLCQKPSTEGLIYPQFDRDVHMLTAAEMAAKITGSEYPENLTKAELIQIMKEWELRWGAGMDFGFSHRFAVVSGATDGYRAFVLNVISEAELDPTQQVEICKREIKALEPSIYPDPENPQMIRTLRKAGFRMREWKKGPGTVIGGIDIVRMLLRPAIGEPRLFLLKDDEGCELLAKRMLGYHWKVDPDGRIGKVPDEEDDDECDAIRYWLMNFFAPKGAIKAAREMSQDAPSQLEEAGRRLFRQILQEQGVNDNGDQGIGRGSHGGFKWDI